MKLHQSKVLSHIDGFHWSMYVDGRYWLPRDCVGFFTYWKICEYFKPKSVLEIGVREGLSLGLFFESTDDDASFVGVDLDLNQLQFFNTLFKDHPKYSSIQFLEMDSNNLDLLQTFDLIHIDGDHSYEFVKNDVEKILPCLHKNSILIIDDLTKECPDVERVVDEFLLGQHDFVPFLSSSREMFFHHVLHDANDFLDNFLLENSTDLITFFNYDYKGFIVTKGHIPNFFNDNKHIFVDQLKKYNL